MQRSSLLNPWRAAASSDALGQRRGSEAGGESGSQPSRQIVDAALRLAAGRRCGLKKNQTRVAGTIAGTMLHGSPATLRVLFQKTEP